MSDVTMERGETAGGRFDRAVSRRWLAVWAGSALAAACLGSDRLTAAAQRQHGRRANTSSGASASGNETDGETSGSDEQIDGVDCQQQGDNQGDNVGCAPGSRTGAPGASGSGQATSPHRSKRGGRRRRHGNARRR